MSTRTKTSSQLKEKIKQIMKDGKKRNVPEIKQELQKLGMVMDKDYNTNHISGVLNVLKSSGYLKNPERGYYQKNEDYFNAGLYSLFDMIEIENEEERRKKNDEEVLSLQKEIQKRLNDEIEFIENSMKEFDYSAFSSQGLLAASRIVKIMETLKEIK